MLDVRAALFSAEVLDGVELDAVSNQTLSSPAVVDDRPKNAEPYGILETVVRQTTLVVRLDDVLNALRVVADPVLPAVAKVTRLEQGRLDDTGGLVDPFALDRATAGARRGEPCGRVTGVGLDAVGPAV